MHVNVHCTDDHVSMHIRCAISDMEKEAVEMMTDLLHRGLDINSRTKYGKTALHIALESNSGDKDDNMIIEEFLLDKNADIFAKTDCGDTILHSVFNGCVVVVVILCVSSCFLCMLYFGHILDLFCYLKDYFLVRLHLRGTEVHLYIYAIWFHSIVNRASSPVKQIMTDRQV